jgi:anthranilate synthase component 1
VPEPLLQRNLPVSPETLLTLASRHPQRYPVLFDSASEGPLSRFTVLVACNGGSLELDRTGRLTRDGAEVEARSRSPFLDALDLWWKAEASGAPVKGRSDSPWQGGFAVFLSYEMAAEVEPTLRLPRSDEPLRAFALRTPAAIVHDHASSQVYALAEPGSAHWLDLIEADAGAAHGVADATTPLTDVEIEEESPARYLAAVRRVQEYIAAGDVYQVNLSRGWQARIAAASPRAFDSVQVYRQLRRANPAPFAVLARWGELDILSSSPERLVRIHDGVASSRPIAGTRPRGPDLAADADAATGLRAHPKERAEHVMLIDLERNDLGRVCEAGSVVVDEFMAIESYAHVHHIVSQVSGRVRAGVTPVDVLRALFPGGTITGCPKVRCMQIIAELEQTGRGAYTGSIGMLGLDGSADFNILIRTMTRVGEQLRWRAGAGIVADSSPERELEETRAKARGLLRAFDPIAAKATTA